MRYILYLFTMALLFVGGMMVGNIYLPPRAATLAASVSVPPLSQENPILQNTTAQTAQRNLNILNEALQSCPVVVNEEKDRLVNQIRVLLALEDFEIKKAQLELEIAKNTDTNRPTSQFVQAVSAYNEARTNAEQLANELFPLPAPTVEPTAEAAAQPAEGSAETAVSKTASSGTAAPSAASQSTPKEAAAAPAKTPAKTASSQQKAPAEKTAEADAKK